jgi:rifampin ADP-ribosylating transferase
VLLLHGWAASRREFVRLTPLLPAWLRIVAIDLRGHGDADRPAAGAAHRPGSGYTHQPGSGYAHQPGSGYAHQPGSGYALSTLAADVVAAMDALHLPDAVLLGSSSGGYVAQQVAVDAPDRVAGLVLAGAPHDLRGRAPFADEVERLRDPVDPAWARGFTTGFAAAPLPAWYLDLLVEDALRLPASVWRATLDGLVSSRPPTDLGSVTAPTLVVSGARDSVLGADRTRALVAAIPGARWIEYADAGHLVLWDQPARLAADVAAFLPTVAPSGP